MGSSMERKLQPWFSRIKYIFNSYRIQTNYRESLETELKNDNNIEIWLSKLRNDYYNQKAQEVREKRNELLKDRGYLD